MAARVLKGEKLEQEMARLEAMAEYEKEYDACTYICGIDEAGRGPLAGPVAAGAVVLPKKDADPVSQRFQKTVGKAP